MSSGARSRRCWVTSRTRSGRFRRCARGGPSVTSRHTSCAALRSRPSRWRSRSCGFGGRYNTLVADDARRAARRPVAELMADFQRHDGSRRRPFGTWVTDPLLDVLVHTQDTAVPPGRPDPMPIEPGGVAARRAHRLGFLFADFALRRHVEIQATDADFNVGKRAAGRGPHLRGPLAADRTHSRDGTRSGRPRGRTPHLRNCSPSPSAGMPAASPTALHHNRCSTAGKHLDCSGHRRLQK